MRDLDRDAEMWARQFGVELPQEDTGKLLRGRSVSQDLLEKVHQRQRTALELRHYREVVDLRLKALMKAFQMYETEISRLRTHQQILQLMLEGDGTTQEDVARIMGHANNSWTHHKLNEIRRDASLHTTQGTIRVPCACGRPKCVAVVSLRSPTKRYKSNSCRWWINSRKRRWRLRTRKWRSRGRRSRQARPYQIASRN